MVTVGHGAGGGGQSVDEVGDSEASQFGDRERIVACGDGPKSPAHVSWLMPTDPAVERRLRREFTGLVVESLAVKQDFGAATIGCRGCSGTTLGAGDRVTVTLTCYENHSWEIQSVFCGEHVVETVEEAMAIRAEEQAVVSAVLEPAGYYPPRGAFQPDALTLGNVDIVDVSPTDAGYDHHDS